MTRLFLLLLLFVTLMAAALAYPRLRRGLQLRHAEAAAAADANRLREGDLIFHSSLSAQSKAIQLATRSRYSHCGIVFRQSGQWRVFEAVQPVSNTPLARWIARGEGGHYVVKRLRDADQTLTPAALRRLKQAGQQFNGKNYDLYFEWSNDRIYCSELLWKMYKQALGREIGQLQQLREFDLSHPAVRQKMRERYGRQVPLHEQVISPVRMKESPELVTVLKR